MAIDPVDILRELIGQDPDSDSATAAIAVLTSPDVAAAAFSEQLVLERLEAAAPHLVEGVFQVVEHEPIDRGGVLVTGSSIEGPTDCPDCARGTVAAGGNVLRCIQVPVRVGALGGRPGDIVACGRER